MVTNSAPRSIERAQGGTFEMREIKLSFNRFFDALGGEGVC
jgi:hypothetical protein